MTIHRFAAALIPAEPLVVNREITMSLATITYTFELLRAKPADELVEMWRVLESPTLEEMDGEYQGAFPSSLAIEHARVRKTEGPGEWLAKGFAPIPHGKYPGQGYNVWFTPERVVRVMRFAGEVAPSLIDGRPALMGYYGAFHSHNSHNGMTNEVRKIEDGLYLGIISTNVDHRYWGPVDPSTGRGSPRPFVLRGPTGAWQGVDEPEADPGL